MAQTSIGLVIRQQGWFRAHAAADGLGEFSLENANALTIHPTGSFRARVLVGRGPFEHELTPEFLLWFEHGELEYPVFQSPSIGPSNAALKLSSRPRKIVATADEVISMIDISIVLPVSPTFSQALEPAAGVDADPATEATVRRLQTEAFAWLEQAIGLYALYQYPIVWEPLGVHPVVGFVDLENQTFRLTTRVEPDNFIPFQLNVARRVIEGELKDAGLVDLGKLAGADMELPLALLQRSLWQRNITLRFLETFLILDYLTGRHSIQDEGRKEREEMFDVLNAFIQDKHPAYHARLKALKHVILQAPLRQRLSGYLNSLGMQVEDAAVGRLLKTRNDVAHAHAVEHAEVVGAELEVRRLAREAIRLELASRGIQFEKPADGS